MGDMVIENCKFTVKEDNDPSKLAEGFGDPVALLKSRNWLEGALEAKGAKFDGSAGIGDGEADVDIILDGRRYNVSIRPIVIGR